MNALSRGIPENNRTPRAPRTTTGRFPRLPLALGLGLLAFSIAATAFGMKTGIGTVLNVKSRPQAVRDNHDFRRPDGRTNHHPCAGRGWFRAGLAQGPVADAADG
jgi:hypothetical protein